MVSVAVSKMGVTELMFVDPGVKVNGQYYRNVLLSRQMIPAIKQVAGDIFVFQQDSALAHGARDTIHLLQRETPDFIGPDAQQFRPDFHRLLRACVHMGDILNICCELV